jgi:uncharacterized membrane protein YkvA (DUF1232 family)
MALKAAGMVKTAWLAWVFQLITHLPNFFKLVSRLVKDPRVSLGPKLLLAGTLLYVLLPTDFQPDFLVRLGRIDDLAVVLTGLKFFLQLCPREVLHEHLQAISSGRSDR